MASLLENTHVASAGRREAWLDQVEFVEVARVLKHLARDLGQDSDAAINALAHRGLDAALAHLADASGSSVAAAFLEHRARWREAALAPVH